jgi:hypothetical protein
MCNRNIKVCNMQLVPTLTLPLSDIPEGVKEKRKIPIMAYVYVSVNVRISRCNSVTSDV